MWSYHDLLKDVLRNGEPHADRTGTGTRSVFGRQWRHDMREGFPLLTTKFVSYKNILNELRWFLSGSTNEKDLAALGTHIWKEWATAEQCAKFGREEGDLGPVYGRLWRAFGSEKIDQIENLLRDLKEKPNSRRLIVSGWDPYRCHLVSLPPCHTLWQVKVHESFGQISLHLYARSIDIFLGLPYNIASYASLLIMLSAYADLEPRDLIISFGDLHLYENHIEQAEQQLDRIPYTLPGWQVKTPGIVAGMDAVQQLASIDIELTNYIHHPAIKAEVSV
jgi:thymidylate synthase